MEGEAQYMNVQGSVHLEGVDAWGCKIFLVTKID